MAYDQEAVEQVVIYPAFDAFYYSFYIEGIRTIFGESNIRFVYEQFPTLDPNCFAFTLIGNNKLRVLIDAYDGAQIHNHLGISWCDIHGKVNLVSSAVPESYRSKSVAVGPSFPIRIWSPSKSWSLACRNYRVAVHGFKNAREHFANYRRQYVYRLPLSQYAPGPVSANYIFHASTLWSEVEGADANRHRAEFMKACKSARGVFFEGGFNPSANTDLTTRYSECIGARPFPHAEWLEKTKASMLVFNTPAVWGCHGFKLGEYLALGKAIISTPISRELPEPLVHGQDVHIVDGSPESFRESIEKILRDPHYRIHLERNARKYFLRVLSPEKVVDRLIKSCMLMKANAHERAITRKGSVGSK